MERKCLVCGTPYLAQRPQAKYCGATCRQRARRGGLAGAPPAAVAAATAAVNTVESAGSSSGLIAAVTAELEAAGRLNTVAGQHALELANRIVNAPGMNTGVAALSKQLQAVLAEALRDAATSGAVDPVDELKARRDAKRRRTA